MTGWWVTSLCPTTSTTQSSGLELRSPLSHLCCRNRGFSHLCESLCSVSASKKGHFQPLSLPPESPFPALSGDRFDDWLVGHRFVPYNLHHPVLGLKPRSSFSHLLRPEWRVSRIRRSLCIRSQLVKTRHFGLRLCSVKFRSQH
jgi:hypothetical protein